MRAKWAKWAAHRAKRPLATESSHGRYAKEEHSKQPADYPIRAKHTPQNAQRLQMPRNPGNWYIERHRRLLIRLIPGRRSDHLRAASRAKMNTFRDYCTTCLTDHLTPPYIQAHSLLRIPPASSSLRDYDRRSELARTIAVNTLSPARSQCCRARMAPPARPHRRPHLLAARTRLDSCT